MKKVQTVGGPPLLIYVIGGSLLCIALFLRLFCHRRRMNYHSPLDVEQITLSENIARRKKDLNRFIGTLESQLAARKHQLEMHDRVEQVLTARQAMEEPIDENDDPQWKAIMERGRVMYGDDWEQGKDGELPLGVQMNMYKEELLATSRKVDTRTPEEKLIKAIERQNQAAIMQQAFVMETARSRSRTEAKRGAVLPLVSQWKSQRRSGTPISSTDKADSLPTVSTSSSWSKNRLLKSANSQPVSAVPKLNMSAVHGGMDHKQNEISVKDILKGQWR